MNSVAVIIPIYKSELSFLEKKSLTQTCSVLFNYDIIVIKPKNLQLNHLQEGFPLIKFQSFNDSFFVSKRSYNRLMLSSDFYERFLDYEYILICQLDAYVFKDELVEWCNKGYDYIGAPWIPKPLYTKLIIRDYRRVLHWWKKIRNKPSTQSLNNKIGNGGFSLRKVSTHYKATITYNKKIDYYLSQQHRLYNEDVFWATEVPEFVYPTLPEAIQFSFEKYPKYCFKINNNKLPFGCYAWHKTKMRKFWKPIIGF
jgi:hypothetical protein